VLLDIRIDLIAFFRAEMADRAVDQLQIGLDRLCADLPDLLFLVDAPDMRVRTELQIDIVRFADQFLGFFIPEDIRQVAADIG
jgi:hypothetical protein